MILQALVEYYERKAADSDSDIAPEGFEKKEVPFLVVINDSGEFVNLEDTREAEGKRLVAKTYVLPRSRGRSGINACQTTFLLWDHIGYLFGHPDGNQKASNQHATWLNVLHELPVDLVQDEGVQAILRFYDSPGNLAAAKGHPLWLECLKVPSCNMTFRLVGDGVPVPCRDAVQKYVRANCVERLPSEDGEDNVRITGLCMVTGMKGEIARTHARTPINKDTKSLVAFQKNSGYDSYGKEQGFNAPVGKSAEFAYTTALNTLLKSKRQRIRVGDAVTVFWSAKKSPFENEVTLFFDEPPPDDPDHNAVALRAMYASIWNGTYVVPDDDTQFYVLGLSPNSARIAIRFWHVATVMEMGNRFKQHIDDLTITHGDSMNPALPVRRLLHSVAPLEDDDKLPPNLAGDVVRAVLDGLPYPHTLLLAALARIRAEQARKNKRTGKPLPNVTYERAAIIKACINRSTRYKNSEQREEIHMSLDTSNQNSGYRLGRLFATLEKIQQEASPGINATIRDRFYGAASSTPVTVFGNLMRLKNHHIAKLENVGRRVQFEKLIGEVMSGITDFPPHLPLEDQGRFAIGYYHQMQEFYTRKTNNQNKED